MERSAKIMVLDYLRGFSALYIVFHHMRDFFPFPTVSKPLLSFGQETVVVFLLLSGFTNFYSLNKKEFYFKQYIFKKYLRIYPLLLFTLLITYMIGGMPQEGGGRTVLLLAGNVLNLSSVNADIHFKVSPWMGNLPLWSLTYIWWYYFLIGLFKKFVCDGKYLLRTFLLLSVIGELSYKLYPSILSLILIYSFILATGSYVCWCVLHDEFTLQRVIKIVGSYIVILAIHCLVFRDEFINFSLSQHFQYPYCEVRHFGISAILVALIYAVKHFHLTRYFEIGFKPFRIVSSFSYALYIIHFNLRKPLMLIDIGVNPHFQLLLTIIVICFIAYIMEVHIQKWFVSLHSKNK